MKHSSINWKSTMIASLITLFISNIVTAEKGITQGENNKNSDVLFFHPAAPGGVIHPEEPDNKTK